MSLLLLIVFSAERCEKQIVWNLGNFSCFLVVTWKILRNVVFDKKFREAFCYALNYKNICSYIMRLMEFKRIKIAWFKCNLKSRLITVDSHTSKQVYTREHAPSFDFFYFSRNISAGVIISTLKVKVSWLPPVQS